MLGEGEAAYVCLHNADPLRNLCQLESALDNLALLMIPHISCMHQKPSTERIIMYADEKNAGLKRGEMRGNVGKCGVAHV